MHQRYITQFPLAPPKILVSIFVTIKIDIIKKKKGKDNEEASYQKFQPLTCGSLIFNFWLLISK